MITATRVILIAVVVVLAGWTTVMTIARNYAATVSFNVLTFAVRAPVFVLVFSVLLGHWLWPRYPGHGDAVFDLFNRYPVLLIPLGLFIGRLFWPQTP